VPLQFCKLIQEAGRLIIGGWQWL